MSTANCLMPFKLEKMGSFKEEELPQTCGYAYSAQQQQQQQPSRQQPYQLCQDLSPPQRFSPSQQQISPYSFDTSTFAPATSSQAMDTFMFPSPAQAYQYGNHSQTQTESNLYNITSNPSSRMGGWQQQYDSQPVEGLSIPMESQGSNQSIASYSDVGRMSPSRSPPSLGHTASLKDDEEEDEEYEAQNDSDKAEEPYAKLIHRALMEAPNHVLHLQEIYQWFLRNTDKGKSGGTGWRNSIRHNLSMNAAFRKTDRNPGNYMGPHTGSKKSSEWTLEPFAIAGGVTPTTRYRKPVPKKLTGRNGILHEGRAMSGRKGGVAAGKTKSRLIGRPLSMASGMSMQRQLPAGMDPFGGHDGLLVGDQQNWNLYNVSPRGSERSYYDSPATPAQTQNLHNHAPYFASRDQGGLFCEEPQTGMLNTGFVEGYADGFGLDDVHGVDDVYAQNSGLLFDPNALPQSFQGYPVGDGTTVWSSIPQY